MANGGCKTSITYWFDQASAFSRVWQAADAAREREYVNFRLEQGDPPDTIALPPHFHRIDKWLPRSSKRLSAIRRSCSACPVPLARRCVSASSDYGKALDHLATLPTMLNTMAEAWHRPGPGQPSLELESGAVELLTYAIEDYTGREFPSPRSYKRLAEIELVRLLQRDCFRLSRQRRSIRCSDISTSRRLGKARDGANIHKGSTVEYSA